MSGSPEMFDPYWQWLGIEPRARPLTHYSLLGLPLFEADAGRIARAADERMTLIRQFQMGPRGAYTQRILNELATARICLLSPVHKAAYDESLRAALLPAAPPAAPPSIESAPRPKRKLAEVMPPAWEGNVATTPEAPPVVPPAARPKREVRLEPVAPVSRGLKLVFVALGSMAVLIAVLGFLLVQRLLHPPAIRPVAEMQPDYGEIEPGERVKPLPELEPKAVIVLQEGSGELNLTPATALVEGELAREVQGTLEVLVGWESAAEIAEWRFKLVKPGFFELELEYVSHPSLAGKIVTIAWDCVTKPGPEMKRIALRAPEAEETVRDSQIVLIKRGGEHTLTMQPAEALPKGALQLISVRLIPAVGP
jgi:hypothetical protein